MIIDKKYKHTIQKYCKQIKLYDHQLSSVQCMIHMETHRNLCFKNNRSTVNFAFLRNNPGSGKSYVILELSQYRNNIEDIPFLIKNNEINHFLYSQNNCSNKYYTKINMDIIIVPHTIFYQWVEFANKTEINCFCINGNKSRLVLINQLYDVYSGLHINTLFGDLNKNILPTTIIIKNSMFNELSYHLNKLNLVVNRIFVDEFDTITNINLVALKADFIWFISGSNNIKYNHKYHFDNQIIYDYINERSIKCTQRFIDKSIQIEPYEVLFHYYKLSTSSNIIANLFKNLEYIANSYSVNDMKTFLNISDKNTEYIYNIILQRLYIQEQNENNQDMKLKIKSNIERLETAIKNYECIICMNTNEDNLITNCCAKVCCSECIFNMIKNKHKICPNCRESLENTYKIYAKSKQVLSSQVECIIQIINNYKDGQFLICSDNENSYYSIINYCNNKNIKYMNIKGTGETINNLINKFNNGEIKIIFFTVGYQSVGINLSKATDVIIFDKVNLNNWNKQIIGRAQRLGRTTKLRVHIMKKFEYTSY